VSKTANKLDGLDTSAWTEDEKDAFNQTLQNLHESIQAILNPWKRPTWRSGKMKAKTFINHKIINDYNSITYVGARHSF